MYILERFTKCSLFSTLGAKYLFGLVFILDILAVLELGQCNEGSVSLDDGTGRQKTIISFLFDSAHLGQIKYVLSSQCYYYRVTA